jgi:methionyl-tRNA synthetase
LPAGTKVRKGEPIFPRVDVDEAVAYIVASMSGGAKPSAPAGEESPNVSAGASSQSPTAAGAGVPAPGNGASSSAASPADAGEGAGLIGIEDFAKVELRVAQVIAAEPVKKADKLLKLQLDLGNERRQVVSGIAKHYSPEQLVGRKVICVTNLKPVTLRGELSQGMILAASEGDRLTLATVSEDIPNGAIVK